MPDLSVNVNRNDIVVSKPSSGLSVTYRRTGRVLVALDSMRRDPKGEELMFLVRAWNAAFANLICFRRPFALLYAARG
jgi:hypothetical protein